MQQRARPCEPHGCAAAGRLATAGPEHAPTAARPLAAARAAAYGSIATTEAHSLLDAGELAWRYDAFAEVRRPRPAPPPALCTRRLRRPRQPPGRTPQVAVRAGAGITRVQLCMLRHAPTTQAWTLMFDEYCLASRFKSLQLKVCARLGAGGGRRAALPGSGGT